MQVRSVSPDPSGQWLASSSDDGTVKLWEVRTGRCSRTWTLGGVVHCVAWCPNASLSLLAATVDTRVILLPTGELLHAKADETCCGVDQDCTHEAAMWRI